MKKFIAAALISVMALGLAGCSTTSTDTSKASEESSTSASVSETVEETTTTASEETSETTTETSETSEETSESSASVTVPGTWQSVTSGVSEDGSAGPAFYVRFTDKEINYGYMKDGKFEIDYSDEISRIEEISADRYLVRAETSDGKQYTFRTSEEDSDVMEFYGSWDEKAFADTYSGASSLMKSVTD